MSKYRQHLPQLDGKLFVTDGGLETSLIFLEHLDLPYFAAFDLLKDDLGIARLRNYYIPYLELARQHQLGFVLEAPTWRANRDWAERLGYSDLALADANRTAVGLLLELRAEYETPECPMVISGNLGPRADGYRIGDKMTAAQAQAYHAEQIGTFAGTDADMLAAFTLNYVEEAIGIALAARAAQMPLALSFTLETDGRLPSGQSLADAIAETDAASQNYPAYYMVNCAHPSHFEHVFNGRGAWLERIRGLRANASKRSHAELDECSDLDAGNPEELGHEYLALRTKLPKLSVVGGCCGTDHRHLGEICKNLT